MKIAVVVVTFNRLDLLKEVVASIRRQTVKPDAVIVVDNGSADGTGAWLCRETGLTVIFQENAGGAGGFHTGIKYAYEHAFDWIWCMDDDVSPRPDCLQHLLENDSGSVGILCPARIQNGKTVFTEIVEFNLANPFSRIGKIRLKDLPVGDKAIEIKGMSFEGPLIKREVVAKIGYPEKELFLFYDDTDYSYRAVSEGYKVLYVPGAVLDKACFDDGLSRVEQVVRKKWRLKYHLRNTAYFCKKYGKNLFFRYFGSMPLYLHMFGAICCNLPRNEKYTFGDIKMLFEMYANGIKGRLGKNR